MEVKWDPEPLLESVRGLSAREMDAIHDCLAVIRTWIKHLGLGDLEVRIVLVTWRWVTISLFARLWPGGGNSSGALSCVSRAAAFAG